MLTVESLRATVAAGDVPVHPRVLLGDEREAVRTVAAEMLARDMTVREMSAAIGFRSVKSAEEFCRVCGLAPTAAAKQRVMAAFAEAGRAAVAAKSDAQLAKHRDAIISMTRAGQSAKEIGRTIGLGNKVVQALLKRIRATTPLPRHAADHSVGRLNAERRAEQARKIRALLDQGMSGNAAAKAIGMDHKTVHRLMAKHGWRAKSAPVRAEQQVITPHKRNPFLTRGQQANADVQRRFLGTKFNRVVVAPPSREEAERAVAEFLAKRSVTVCASVRVDIPSNFGERWT